MLFLGVEDKNSFSYEKGHINFGIYV